MPDGGSVRINYLLQHDDHRTPQDKQKEFLQNFRDCASVKVAADRTKISRTLVYIWKEQDQLFLQEWDMALKEVCGAMEDEAIRRAMRGTKKPVYQGGLKVGEITTYSDVLLMFLMRGWMKEKYADVKQTGSSADEGALLILPSNGRDLIVEHDGTMQMPIEGGTLTVPSHKEKND